MRAFLARWLTNLRSVVREWSNLILRSDDVPAGGQLYEHVVLSYVGTDAHIDVSWPVSRSDLKQIGHGTVPLRR